MGSPSTSTPMAASLRRRPGPAPACGRRRSAPVLTSCTSAPMRASRGRPGRTSRPRPWWTTGRTRTRAALETTSPTSACSWRGSGRPPRSWCSDSSSPNWPERPAPRHSMQEPSWHPAPTGSTGSTVRDEGDPGLWTLARPDPWRYPLCMRWHCPSWGCRGVISSDEQPRHGQIMWCHAREDGEHARPCGRPFEWHHDLAAWVPAHL